MSSRCFDSENCEESKVCRFRKNFLEKKIVNSREREAKEYLNILATKIGSKVQWRI